MFRINPKHIIPLIVCFFLCGCNVKDSTQNENNGESISQLKVDTIKIEDTKNGNVGDEYKKIAITFDDGPVDVDGGTAYLLDGLKERGVKATFFVTGKRVKENPDLTRRMYEEGHLIGNHTYNHVKLTNISEEDMRKEIDETNKLIKYLTGSAVAYMRPPYGAWNKTIEEYTDMIPVLWDIDPRDWENKNQAAIVEKVVTNAEENAIILLHDGYKTSADAAFEIIDILKDEGYTFVTVDEVLMN